MKCYFCHQLGGKTNHLEVVDCDSCAKKFDLPSIYTSYNGKKAYLAHIYVQRKELIHVQLWINENKTKVYVATKDKLPRALVATLEGFPIAPHNAKQKLETILTFL